MSSVAWSAIAAIALFMLSHIGLTIWWASRVNTLLTIVERDLTQIVVEFRAMKETYLSKEAFSYRVSQSDHEHQAMWKRIDELAEKA